MLDVFGVFFEQKDRYLQTDMYLVFLSKGYLWQNCREPYCNIPRTMTN